MLCGYLNIITEDDGNLDVDSMGYFSFLNKKISGNLDANLRDYVGYQSLYQVGN